MQLGIKNSKNSLISYSCYVVFYLNIVSRIILTCSDKNNNYYYY